ncbi:MAG: TIM44-like domain-containing protein [Nitrospinota bacterium]|nr:TIM44-like domain-containing protein [Nitrospinota bacterium]
MRIVISSMIFLFISFPGAFSDFLKNTRELSPYIGSIAEARRFGGMRSFGFRGSRGLFSRRSFGSRSRFGSFGSRRAGFGRRGFSRRPAFGGFGRSMFAGIGGFFLGSMLGRMLFPGMGAGGGFGLLEIILIFVGIFLLMRFIRNRTFAKNSNYSYGNVGVQTDPSQVGTGYGYDDTGHESGGRVSEEDSYSGREIDEGLRNISNADNSFSADSFSKEMRTNFIRFQEAYSNRDVSSIKDLVDGDILKNCEIDIEEMQREKTINKLENINIGKSEFVEVWQENGYDFVTVRYEVSLLDYVVKEDTGDHISGSTSAPIHFTEHWTWARKTGPNAWFLSAIEQV